MPFLAPSGMWKGGFSPNAHVSIDKRRAHAF